MAIYNKQGILISYWDNASIDEVLYKIKNKENVDFDNSAYDSMINYLNTSIIALKEKAQSPQMISEIEQLKTLICGNNMIAKAFAFTYNYDYKILITELSNNIENNISIEQQLNVIKRDIALGLTLIWAPEFVKLVNASRFTIIRADKYDKRKEYMNLFRENSLINVTYSVKKAIENAEIENIEAFLYNTNFAPAFEKDDVFIGFNHIYDNVEKYCDIVKIGGDKVQVEIMHNIAKILDDNFQGKAFESHSMSKLKNITPEKDLEMDNTKINIYGDKLWQR